MASLLLFVACFFEPGPLEGRACVTDLDCPGGALCAEGFCALSPPDSSADGGAEGEDEATPGDDVSPGDVPQGPRDVESPQDVSDTSGDALDVPEDVVEPGEDISPGDVPPDGPAPNACGGFAELSGAPGQACDVCRGVLVCDGVDALVCETDLPVADAIIVDTVEDVINSPQRCSLRDAVRSVNEGRALGGCDAPVGEVPRVLLSLPGTYALTRVGRLENNGLTGDLDVLGALSVQSCRQGTSIHGQGADRIFHVQGRLSRLTLIGVSLRRGEVSGGDAVARQGGTSGGVGGAIFNEGALTLRDVVLRNNVVRGGAGADGVSNAGGGGGGGGGGGAFGGAIFNNGGTVTLDNVVFQDNEAVGGRGGDGVINNGFFSGDGGGGGSIGGDGGGGTGVDARGDDGEFGGGGGGGGATNSGSSGGDGGFGGGGGGGGGRTTGGLTGPGGVSRFAGGQGGRGCCSAGGGGGGGGALGGALFNLNGVVSVTDVSFERNVALGGEPGANAFGGADGTEPEGGLGLGGAVFERQASNDFSQASFDGNSADQGANVARQ